MGKDKRKDEDKKPEPKVTVTSRDPKRLVKEEPDEQPEVDADDERQGNDQADAGSDSDQSNVDSKNLEQLKKEYIEQKMELERLQKKYADVDDAVERYARVVADFDNFKRRTQEERAELFDTARAEMALKLMPVIDNFDRAAEHVPENIKKDSWYAGIEGIRKQFNDLLAELGIERIKSVGEPFDPNRHEAISHEPSDEHDKDIISQEFEAGYALGDSVIRPAKVNVSSGKEKA